MSSLSKYGSTLVIGSLLVGNACSSTPSNQNGSGSGSAGGGSGSSSGASSSSGGSPGSGSGSSGSSGSSSGGSSGSSSGGSSGSGSGGSSGSSGSSGSGSGAGDGGPLPEAGLVTGVQGHPDPAITPPTYPGFTLTVDEEFNQQIDLNNDPIWTWSDGGLSEGDVRFIQNQIAFSGGNMVITCSATAQPAGASVAENGMIAAKPLSSGEVRSKYNNFRYGRYETRFKPPTSMGNFISTQFLFRTPKTIAWREIDVELTAGPSNTGSPGGPMAFGTNVYFQNNDTSGAFNGMFQDVGAQTITFNNQADFHVYTIEWLPDHVAWYIDGTLTRTKLPTTPTATPVPIPELSAKAMFNLWVFTGATFAGFGGINGTSQNTYPLVAQYDYFRFYRANVETTYPCQPTPSCLPHADQILSKNNPNDGVTLYTN